MGKKGDEPRLCLKVWRLRSSPQSYMRDRQTDVHDRGIIDPKIAPDIHASKTRSVCSLAWKSRMCESEPD